MKKILAPFSALVVSFAMLASGTFSAACGSDPGEDAPLPPRAEAVPESGAMVDVALGIDSSQVDVVAVDGGDVSVPRLGAGGPFCEAGADLSSDVNNCGACAVRCTATGANTVPVCVSGVCRSVTTLATGQFQPSEIAVNDLEIVWASAGTQGSITRLQKSGGGRSVIAPGQDSPRGLWLSDRYVVWSGSGSSNPIWQFDLLGGAAAPLVLNTYASGVTADSNHLYWISSSANSVSRAAWDGSGRSALANNQSFSGYVLVSDSANLYFAEGMNIRRLAKSGGIISSLGTLTNPEVYGLAVDDQYVYWTNEGRLSKAPKVGGSTSVLVTSPEYLWQIAVDATHVYYVEKRAIMKADKQGANAVQLAPAAGDVGGIVVDATHVYWTDFANGNVLRTAK